MKNINMKGQDKVTKVITDQIIKQLEAGVIPWKKPWIGAGAAWSRSSGKPYNFINQMLLMLPGEYATFEQITKEGGHNGRVKGTKYVVGYPKKVKKGKRVKMYLVYNPNTNYCDDVVAVAACGRIW